MFRSFTWSMVCCLALLACGEEDTAPGPSEGLPDSDGDGIADGYEGRIDADGNGTPAYLDPGEQTIHFPEGNGLTSLAGSPGAGAPDASSMPVGPGDGQDAGRDAGALDAALSDAAVVPEDSGVGDAGGGPLDAGGDPPDADGPAPGETGRMVGMVAAHNAARAMVDVEPPLPELTWNADAAAFAQSWADTLAANCSFMHSNGSGYGENLAYFGPALSSTPAQVVQGWVSEVQCWTYGTIDYPPLYPGTEQCDMGCVAGLNSNGCGHYTQVVWRDTTSVGCGVASCKSGGNADIWVCSYSPAGNYAQQYPY